MRTAAKLGITAIIAVAGIVACNPTAGQTGATAPAVPAGTASTNQAAPVDPGPTGDAKVTSCHVDSDTQWPAATVTITNRSSKTSNYVVSVEFVDGHGTRLAEGTAATNNLAPGQSAHETAQSLDQVNGGSISCRITDVTRYAS